MTDSESDKLLDEIFPPQRIALTDVTREVVAALKHWGLEAERPASGKSAEIFLSTFVTAGEAQTFKITVEEI